MLVTMSTYEECWDVSVPGLHSYLLRHPTFSFDVPSVDVAIVKAGIVLNEMHHGDCVRVMFTVSDETGLKHWGVIGCVVQEGEDIRESGRRVDYSWLIDEPKRIIV